MNKKHITVNEQIIEISISPNKLLSQLPDSVKEQIIEIFIPAIKQFSNLKGLPFYKETFQHIDRSCHVYSHSRYMESGNVSVRLFDEY